MSRPRGKRAVARSAHVAPTNPAFSPRTLDAGARPHPATRQAQPQDPQCRTGWTAADYGRTRAGPERTPRGQVRATAPVGACTCPKPRIHARAQRALLVHPPARGSRGRRLRTTGSEAAHAWPPAANDAWIAPSSQKINKLWLKRHPNRAMLG